MFLRYLARSCPEREAQTIPSCDDPQLELDCQLLISGQHETRGSQREPAGKSARLVIAPIIKVESIS